MKLSWGTRIALLYGGFVALIATLVAGSMRQDFDLVSKDYYAQEIAYQKTIDAGKNQATLSAPVSISTTNEVVQIDFPQEFRDVVFTADLYFYAPVSASMDRKISRLVKNGKEIINRSELAVANYRLKISWESEGRKYYQESALNLIK
jgi:hypothetical protein